MVLATGNRLQAMEQLLERALRALGYVLADFEISNHGSMLRVFIDKIDEHGSASSAGVTLADCETASRHLQRCLAVEAIDYDRLEVSSPGLDRKLKKEADFARFVGRRADVRLRELMGGRRRFVGVIRDVADNRVVLDVEGNSVVLELADVHKARLVPEVLGRSR